MSGQSGGRIRLANLNDQLTCKLCGGYFIDATTIIECLHSFCRSCIVKYLETNKYCPICDVQVHKSKPLLNIRPDHTLQDIVYKLVPGCYQNEMRCRREFYEKHPDAQLSTMSPEARGEPIESHIYSPDESLSLSLEYYNPNFNDNSVVVPVDDSKGPSPALGVSAIVPCPGKIQARRYLRCPAAVTVFHLQKLIRAKHGLSDAHRVDVMYKEESLCGNYTLMDVMYIYHWRRKVPLHLSYRIFESSPKRLKLADDNAHFKETMTNAGISEPKDETTKKEWKEVQLKISETGVMSVTGIHTSPETKKAKVETLEEEQRRLDESVAAVNADKKQETSDKTNLASDSDTSSANSPLPEPQKVTEKSSTSTEAGKSTAAKSTDTKPVTANNNNNSNSNNFNSKTDMGGGSLRVETRDKHKTSTPANETKSNQLPSGSGSKIDAVSAKLQFQPKVGQVNNTYSKKALKEKQQQRGLLEKTLKKSEAKNSVIDSQKETKSTGEKNRSMSSGTTSSVSKTSSQQSKTPTTSQSQSTFLDASTSNTVTSTYSTISTPSVSISITSRRNSSPERSKESSTATHSSSGTFTKRRPSSGDAAEGCNQRSHISTTPSTSPRGSFARQLNNLPPSTESLEKIGLNVSTAIHGLCPSGTSTFPYTVQDLVNNAMLKSPSKSGGSSATSKQSTATSSSLQGPSSSQLTLQTPSMSVYSIPSMSKNSPATSNSGKTKSSVDITTVYSMPPCPDGIPISLMKPTVRKTEILAKGTNINDICAKMSTSGSKINDICAKIGENSKEKIKSETRSRPDVPDLLKITKKPMSSISNDSTTKHIPNIPNVPIYTPSNSVSADSKSIYLTKDTLKISTSTSSPSSTSTVTSTSSSNTSTSSSSGSNPHLSTTSTSAASFQATGKSNSLKKSQSQSSVSYKTLRDPPKPWNPTLSNNYVAAKNQAKEMQSQAQTMIPELGSGHSGSGKNVATSKPAKILKMRNAPRFLGNPLSGVKPMYSENNEGKDANKDQAKLSASNPPASSASSSSSKSSPSGPSMTKIDPKTLSPIVSTNTNSPIVSPPPYSPNARSYQNTPFSRSSSNSPMSPRSTSVNMLSTNPFIPSGKPNTNPRLFYSPFPPPFPDSSRFTANPLIRSAIGMSPSSAFHSSLPPSITKIYHQRTSYLPQTTSATYSQQNLSSQPPTVQRIPPSTHSSSPKSPKTTVASSTFNLAKTETQTSIPTSIDNTSHLGKGALVQETNAFNLSKTGGSNYASDLSKTSTSASATVEKPAKSPSTPPSQTKSPEKSKDNPNEDEKDDSEEASDSGKKKKQEKEKKNADKKESVVKTPANEVDNSSEAVSTLKNDESVTKVNGSPSVQVTNTAETKETSERASENDENKSSEKAKEVKNTEGKNSTASDKSTTEDKDNLKHEDGLKSSEHIQTKKSDTQRNKAES